MHGRLALLTLAALAGTGGALAGAQTQPQPKSPADARAVKIESRAVDLYNRATRHVRGVDAGCRTAAHAPHATFTHDAPSAELLGLLAVLRRPAGPGDQVDQTSLDHLPSEGIYIDYVRHARAADGQTFVVIAARDALVTPAPPPQRCDAEARRWLAHLLRGESRAVRVKGEQVAREAARAEREERNRKPAEGVFLFGIHDGRVTGGGGGGPLTFLRTHGSFISGGRGGESELSGLIPDGVASITFDYLRRVSRGPRYKPRSYRHAFTRTVDVHDNVVDLHVPRDAEDALAARQVWRAADGSVVRVVKPLR